MVLPRLRRCVTMKALAARFSSSLTREEAGRRAQELASSRNTTTNNSAHMHVETTLAHAGIDHENPNAGMSPLLDFSTTFVRRSNGEYLPNDSIYSRADNPTRLLLEHEISQLECHSMPRLSTPATSCAFSSGMMAASAIILAHESPIRVLLPKDLYHGVPTVLNNVFRRFGVTTHSVDMTSSEAVQRELKELLSQEGDIILWIETPSNPQVNVIDIQEICAIAKETHPQITTVVDSTLAPPTIQQPLSLGADLVMHSVTKGIGGHSDLTAGIVTCSPITERGIELGPKLKDVQISMGGVASPMDSWLAIRGMRSLAVRVERQCQNSMAMAKFLQEQSQQRPHVVASVHYPGLETHPQHTIAKKQMMNGCFGGVLSLETCCETQAFALAGALQVIQRATSLGGSESLIEHRASIEPADRVASPPGLLRISAGLENQQDLIQDLKLALEVVEEVHKEF